jgi:hypothetical protein
MSTANNATPTSSFLVRADQFAIGSPTGPGITPVVPFRVNTTMDADGNPPGVFMDSAVIKNAAITTLRLKNGSVSEKAWVQRIERVQGTGGYIRYLTMNFSMAYAGFIYVWVTGKCDYTTVSSSICLLTINGSIISRVWGSFGAPFDVLAISGGKEVAAGTYSIEVIIIVDSTVHIEEASMMVMGVYR